MGGSFVYRDMAGLCGGGVFDCLYTCAGDYLVGNDPCGDCVTYFVAAHRPLLPAQCVRTNGVLRVLRPPAPMQGGYGGFVEGQAITVIQDWPASILSLNAHVSGSLPETKFGNWVVLLPRLPVEVIVGDVIADDLGRSFLVAAAEESDMGWRIIARQVAA